MTVTLCCTGLADSGIMPPMKCREIIADKLSAADWLWGYCSAVTQHGRQAFVSHESPDGGR